MVKFLSESTVECVNHMGTDLTVVQSARVSTGSDSTRDAERLIMYLRKNSHSSPFESCILQFNIHTPIFVARQFMRHRTGSFNEWSGRYSVLEPTFYLPETWREQSTKNKQGSEGDIEVPQEQIETIKEIYERSYKEYEQLLARGVTRELARIILPVSMYTKFMWTSNLHNIFHFLKLRLAPDAQKEIRDVTGQINEHVGKLYPLCHKAFTLYDL